ncbi:MAG TPA: hypothetical protein VF307_07825 [Candidatus Nanopelagicaceae bacterium]
MVRFLLVFIKKEETIAHKYNHEHPRYKWYLLMDAVLTSLLMYGGVAFASQPTSILRSVQLMKVGAVSMSLTEMTDHFKDGNKTAYWLGPMSSTKYTYVDNSTSRIAMTYWPLNSNTDLMDQSKFTIETFMDPVAYATSLYPLADPNSAKIVTANGTTVEFNQASLNYEIVTFKDKAEVVVINYPTWQLETTLMNNAEALKGVS